MKNFTIVASLFLLVGCATGHKQVTPAPVVEIKLFQRLKNIKNNIKRKFIKHGIFPSLLQV